MICPKCGFKADDDAKFCPSCGETLSAPAAPQGEPVDQTQSAAPSSSPAPNYYQSAPTPPPPPPAYQAPFQQPYYQMPAENPSLREPLSMGGFFVTLLVMAIPLVNIIMLFVWGFSSTTNINRRNFSRAALIMVAIGIVLGILFGLMDSVLSNIISEYVYYNF